jgi:hypothetical protein
MRVSHKLYDKTHLFHLQFELLASARPLYNFFPIGQGSTPTMPTAIRLIQQSSYKYNQLLL